MVFEKNGLNTRLCRGAQGARRKNTAVVEGLPAELPDDIRNFRLGTLSVAAQKHGRSALFVVRIDHVRSTDAIKRLHNACLWDHLLELFSKGLIGSGSVQQNTIDWRRIG